MVNSRGIGGCKENPYWGAKVALGTVPKAAQPCSQLLHLLF